MIVKSVDIDAPASTVWAALTKPDMMRQWMAEPGMTLSVVTDWTPGSPIVITGFHHLWFENKGIVIQFEPEKSLSYNYLSSISRLVVMPENHTVITFALKQQDNKTNLTVSISNFPTAVIRQHVDFYWNGTLEILKKFVENQTH